MFQRVVTLWRQNEAWLRLWLLVSGIGLLIVEIAFPTKAMLAWREALNLQSVSFMSALLLVAVCGSILAGLLTYYRKWQWGWECILITLFIIMSVPFAPIYWTIVQSIALGVGFGVMYR